MKFEVDGVDCKFDKVVVESNCVCVGLIILVFVGYDILFFSFFFEGWVGCIVVLEFGDKVISFESGFGCNVGVGISVKCEKVVFVGFVEVLDKVLFVKYFKIIW